MINMPLMRERREGKGASAFSKTFGMRINFW